MVRQAYNNGNRGPFGHQRQDCNVHSINLCAEADIPRRKARFHDPWLACTRGLCSSVSGIRRERMMEELRAERRREVKDRSILLPRENFNISTSRATKERAMVRWGIWNNIESMDTGAAREWRCWGWPSATPSTRRHRPQTRSRNRLRLLFLFSLYFSKVELWDDVIGFVERCARNPYVLRALNVRLPLKTLPGNEPIPSS